MAKLKAAENWPVRDASPCPQVRPSRKDSLVPADPGPEAGDDDDGNLAEPWTVAQAQKARADAGCTDLEAALAAVAATKRWWRRLRRGARGPRRGCSRL